MRVLFIEPPFYSLMQFQGFGFPVGLAQMGAILERAGHVVQVMDADFTRDAPRTNPDFLDPFYGEYLAIVNDPAHHVWRGIEERIRTFAPDMVGIGVMTPKVASAIRVAEAARRAAPLARILVGGAHPTMRAEEMMRACPEIDCAVRGDGFSLLDDIVATVESGEPLPKVLDGDPSKVDFDALPPPGRHLLDQEHAYGSGELGLMVTTMGCPWRCTFCSTHTIWNKRRASRTAEKVVEEMIAVHRTYGIGSINFLDDVFTLEKDKVREICERLIEADLPINWTCCTHANLVTEDLVPLMKRAGCTKVAIGIETGSPRMLKLVRKGLSHERIKRAVRILEENRLNWTGFFMIGLLDESTDEMLQTLALMKELDPPYANLGVYANIPGTPLFEHGRGLGITDPDMTREQYFSRAPNRYYFKDGERLVASLDSKEYEKFAQKVMRAFHRHNHSPLALVKRAWRRRHDYLRHPEIFVSNVRRLAGKLGIATAAARAEQVTRERERSLSHRAREREAVLPPVVAVESERHQFLDRR